MDKLYQDIIMRHFKSPQNFAPVTDEEMLADEENPTCGDHFRMTLDLDEEKRIKAVRFDGKGCAISTASCSLMTERVIGLTAGEAEALANHFIEGMNSRGDADTDEWGDLKALEGVKKFPMRVKCATLCWVALKRSLERVDE